MLKEEKLLDMRKCKECTLGEVCELEQEFAARVSYLVYMVASHIYSDVYSDILSIYRCLYV